MSNEDHANNLYLSILNSAATITIVSASLYYLGYMYLYGFYRAFGIPIDSLNTSFETIVLENRIIFIPIILIIIYILWTYLFDRVIGDVIKNQPGYVKTFFKLFIFYNTEYVINKSKKISGSPILLVLSLALLILVISYVIPFIGGYQANMQMEDRSIFILLENPTPKVVVYSTEPLPSIDPDTNYNGTGNYKFKYQNFRLITSTDTFFYLFNPNRGTYQVSKEKALLVYGLKSTF